MCYIKSDVGVWVASDLETNPSNYRCNDISVVRWDSSAKRFNALPIYSQCVADRTLCSTNASLIQEKEVPNTHQMMVYARDESRTRLMHGQRTDAHGMCGQRARAWVCARAWLAISRINRALRWSRSTRSIDLCARKRKGRTGRVRGTGQKSLIISEINYRRVIKCFFFVSYQINKWIAK